MFFRKKKYDLASVDRDSVVSSNGSSSSNRMSYASSASSGYSSGSGETLSRKKELRRLSAMSQIHDGSSARSSNSSLNHFSVAPSPDSTPHEATRKQRICPVFEQGTPVRRTSSDFAGTTQKKISSDGCTLVQSSIDICSQTKSKAGYVPDKVASSSNSQQRHSFDNQQQQQRKQETTQNNYNNMNSKQETTQNNYNNMNSKQQHQQQEPIKSSPTPGPTNIDDIMNSSQGLKSTQSSASNRSPVLVTMPTEDSGNNNNNNNNNNSNSINDVIATSEALSVSQSSFSLSSSSNIGQMEIKSLRQLRRLAPKSAAPVTIKEDFSRSASSSSSTATTTTTTASTASALNAAATLTTNLSASEPVIDFTAATVDLELESANKKQRSVTTISSISSSSSEKEPSTSATTFSESLPDSSEDFRNHRLESVPLSEPRISYPDETDAITAPTTTTTQTTNIFSITEIVDYPVIVPSEFQEDVEDNNINNNNNIIINNNMTTNIDEECQRDLENLQFKTSCLDNTETKGEGNIKATKLYVGSPFTSNKPTNRDDKNFLPGDENFKVDSNVYLQSNCISRIIIKNDTIAITNAEDMTKDRSEDIIHSGTNAFASSNQDPKALLFQTSDVGKVEKVQNDAHETEPERNGSFRDQRRGTTAEESSVLEESDTRINGSDVDPVVDNIDLNTQVKGQHLLTPSPPPITDDRAAYQVRPKHSATVGKFQLNAASNNFSTKPSNNRKSKSFKDGNDEEVENDHDHDYDDDDDAGDDDDDHEYFKRKKQETIEGRNGSFRGIRNLVKSGISTFVNKEESQFMKNLMEQSKGKIILFTTSMSVIRITRDRCSDVKKILQNHRVYFEERDVYISDDNAKDLIQRFRIERLMSNSEGKPNSDDSNKCGSGHRSNGGDCTKIEYEEMLMKLPRVFVEDFDLGGYEKVFKLNETGVLKKIFKEFPKVEGDITCPGCGGFRYTPCYTCHGSKRSRSNAFTEEFFALRCTKCDDNGLARCRLCNSDQTSGE